ncbi:methylmalonyl Co-A mutase-associated GTPase MeaB [Leptospira mayottensis]|uniref:LAO/AO transport system ATPase n=2 Tax=Leptospira mayottensis TaxID=1137606 RepID=A0AA87SWH1_9LEPT|nr:methylmalonyl Co-A mutase-associated GTPase MeaB [Leptospira mayottensis]AXR62664.1 methylmalonyl Co-A mutase-associated GTPase MeaB [Leptospira mayottensis]AXR66441.1 methylmalonyl Co-A mutase-associated GTPase MeaB [Leptospira mayottensis]AZQ04047.1 methylmalonyl Co-A mutase-associated GTPase MeaB [Leptospira mayottensis 200901116]EKS00064.1 LAO/AO transport system ATPase [Leptospira mayottensis 200901122]TGM95150.1 methylmalonyl Co-A mutase-associated GTPase MeaB [Leptospira mayottensis]
MSSGEQSEIPLQSTGISRKVLPTAEEFVQGVLSGNRVMLARAITLVESSRADHKELAEKIIEACLPHSGKSIRIGITGIPGVGKSTFIESFGMYTISQGKKLAVLTIDPSSQISGGSILGDKTRMPELSRNESAFIRPSPSGKSLGGVARKTRETIYLCEAAGFDTIFVETVGVGQSETVVHSMVDLFLLLLIAGAGDELQGIKRGIMEMADLLAITKADGDNKTRAEITRTETQSAIHFFPTNENGWIPKVSTCSSLSGEGIPEIWNQILEYEKTLKSNGYFEIRRTNQANYWLEESVSEHLTEDFKTQMKDLYKDMKEKVSRHQISSFQAAEKLITEYRKRI